MEPELEKKNQNAQPVEEPTPDQETKAFDVEAIREKVPKEFRGYLDPVVDWANKVEHRFVALEKNLPDQIKKGYLQAMEIQQQKQVEMLQKAAPQLMQGQQGGASGGTLQSLLQALSMGMQMMGGGGQDQEIAQLTKDIMKENLIQMRKKGDLMDNFFNAVISNVASKTAQKVSANIEGI